MNPPAHRPYPSARLHPATTAPGLALFIVIATGGVGCASGPVSQPTSADVPGSQGVVGMQQFDPAETLDIGRLLLGSHESFLMPLGDPSNRPPSYPDARLADRLPPRDVCLRLAVGPDGRVFSVVDVTGRPGCETEAPAEPDFVSSAMQAAQGWRFEPAVRCVFRTADEKEAAANTGCAGAQEIPQAVSLHYRFVFEQKDGRGAVRLMH